MDLKQAVNGLKETPVPKKNCKKCYGRGTLSCLLGDGYIVDSFGEKSPNENRQNIPCSCLHFASK